MAGKGADVRLMDPGQFNLERAELITSEGTFVDLSKSIMELTIV